jgi:hypothetical protein
MIKRDILSFTIGFPTAYILLMPIKPITIGLSGKCCLPRKIVHAVFCKNHLTIFKVDVLIDPKEGSTSFRQLSISYNS